MILDSLFLRNISVLTAAQAVSMLAGLATMALLARGLGPEMFGVLGFGTALLAFFGFAASLGTDTYGTRRIARDRAEAAAVTGSVVGLRLTLAVVAYAAFAGVVLTLDRTATEQSVLLVQGIGLIAIAAGLDFLFQALERLEVIGARQVGAAFLTLGGVWLWVNEPGDVMVAAMVAVGAMLVSVIGVALYAPRVVRLAEVRPRPGSWPAVFKASLPLAVGGIMYTVMFYTDTVMIGLMRSNEEVGLYTAAFRVLAIALVPMGLLMTPFFPRLSAAFGDTVRMGAVGGAFAKANLFVGLPVAAGGFLFAEEVLAVIYGASFDSAALTLRLLMIAALTLYVRALYGPALVAWDREKPYTVVSIAGALLNVALNLVLIPRYGIEGAAVASIVSQGAVAVGFAAIYGRLIATLQLAPLARHAAITTFAVLVAWLFMLWFDGVTENALARLAAGGGVFGVAYLVPALRFGWPFRTVGDMSGDPKETTNNEE